MCLYGRIFAVIELSGLLKDSIRDAYLPNMKRMAAYQLIYKDLVKRNNELVCMLCKWQGLKATQDMAEGSPVVKANTKNAVKSAFAKINNIWV